MFVASRGNEGSMQIFIRSVACCWAWSETSGRAGWAEQQTRNTDWDHPRPYLTANKMQSKSQMTADSHGPPTSINDKRKHEELRGGIRPSSNCPCLQWELIWSSKQQFGENEPLLSSLCRLKLERHERWAKAHYRHVGFCASSLSSWPFCDVGGGPLLTPSPPPDIQRRRPGVSNRRDCRHYRHNDPLMMPVLKKEGDELCIAGHNWRHAGHIGKIMFALFKSP